MKPKDIWAERGDIDDLFEMRQIACSQSDKTYKGYPKTKQEWINLFTEWYDELADIVALCDLFQEFDQAKDRNDYETAITILHKVWYSAPDVVGIHSIVGWNILCDLLSEDYLVRT